ncbi:MAG: YbaK/EbsC family protein [Pirellulales bacterium]
MQLKEFLAQRQVGFEVIEHPTTYDAQRLAHSVHTPGSQVAKTVLLHADHDFVEVLAVLPADCKVDMQKVSQALGGAEVELATEAQVAEHCPDCEVGVLPPFGSQYGLNTLVDESLARQKEIVFEGNSHHEAIRMSFEDYRRLENPTIISFSRR